ncbi:hypothetical protein L207DRAFT_80059 [Hyaloscypha variabilis F]|uniref:Uncharacterized protein n=1 Tax=Hyaloscypha variabilis (strain UAMH 11265 / GT02V1 / F) TaxID=1149755 RepID=A0A2J6RGN1_HYAVF|nr:hypothetical protein L207DRAFT_80059 [Hyaloscypha variabilis F]
MLLQWAKWRQSTTMTSPESLFSLTWVTRFTSDYTRDISCLQRRVRSFPNNAVGPFRSSNDVAGSHIDWRFPSTGRYTTCFPLLISSQPHERRIPLIDLDRIIRIQCTWKATPNSSNPGKSRGSSISKSRPLDGFATWFDGKATDLKRTSGFHWESFRTQKRPSKITRPSRHPRRFLKAEENLVLRQQRFRKFLEAEEDLGNLDYTPMKILASRSMVSGEETVRYYGESHALVDHVLRSFSDLASPKFSFFPTINIPQTVWTTPYLQTRSGIFPAARFSFLPRKGFLLHDTGISVGIAVQTAIAQGEARPTFVGSVNTTSPYVQHKTTVTTVSPFTNMEDSAGTARESAQPQDSETGFQDSSNDPTQGAAMEGKGLTYSTPLPSSGRKKRMDKNMWKSIAKLGVFDPDPSEMDWKMLFGKNTQRVFHPEIEFFDQQWSDAAAGTGLTAIMAGLVTHAEAAVFVAVFTAEGGLLKMRKHVGAPFLGPDNRPLVIDGAPMCGGEREWQNKRSAYTIDDVNTSMNYGTWITELLYKEQRPKEIQQPPPETPEKENEEITVITASSKNYSRNLHKENTRLEKENLKIKARMANLMVEYKAVVHKKGKLERHNAILKTDTITLQNQRITTLETQTTRLVTDIKALGASVGEVNPGDGIAVLERMENSINRGLNEIRAEKNCLGKRPIPIDSDSQSDDSDDESDSDSDIDDTPSKKRRRSSPESAGRKAARSSQHLSPTHRRPVSHQGQKPVDVEHFLDSDMNIHDYFAPQKPLQPPPPLNAKQYIEANGNPLDKLTHPTESVNIPQLRRSRPRKKSTPKKGWSTSALRVFQPNSAASTTDNKSKAGQPENPTGKGTGNAELFSPELSPPPGKDNSAQPWSFPLQDFDKKKGFGIAIRRADDDTYVVVYTKKGQEVDAQPAKPEEIPPMGTHGWPPRKGGSFVIRQEAKRQTLTERAIRSESTDFNDFEGTRKSLRREKSLWYVVYERDNKIVHCTRALNRDFPDGKLPTTNRYDFPPASTNTLAGPLPSQDSAPGTVQSGHYDTALPENPSTSTAQTKDPKVKTIPPNSDSEDDRDLPGMNRFKVEKNPDTGVFEAMWWSEGQLFSRKATKEEIRCRDQWTLEEGDATDFPNGIDLVNHGFFNRPAQEPNQVEWSLAEFAAHFENVMFPDVEDTAKSIQFEDDEYYTVYEREGKIVHCGLAHDDDFPEDFSADQERYEFPPEEEIVSVPAKIVQDPETGRSKLVPVAEESGYTGGISERTRGFCRNTGRFRGTRDAPWTRTQRN